MNNIRPSQLSLGKRLSPNGLAPPRWSATASGCQRDPSRRRNPTCALNALNAIPARRLPPARRAAAPCIAALGVFLLGTPLAGQQTDDRSAGSSGLTSLSIEDLGNIEVTTATRQPEKLISSASAIEVITARAIHRHGALSIPDALSLATGLQVARQDVRVWGITARGFNTSTANKMQVMIDGRLLYTPLYSGIFWDAQSTLMEDIDRIEIVRGPGATLWGSNAVNGVINIITKDSSETQGWFLSGGSGSHHQAFGSARYGGSIGDSTRFRVYGKYESDKELPTVGGSWGDDEREHAQAGFRVDSYLTADDHLTLQGDIYDGSHGIAGLRDGTLSGGNLLGLWNRILDGHSELNVRLYYDRTFRDYPGSFEEDRDTVDVDAQHLWEGDDGSKLTWGANFQYSRSAIEKGDLLQFDPTNRDTRSYSAFAQYQRFVFRDDLGVIVGAKVERNTLSGYEFSPSARVFWLPSDSSTLWASVTQAARKPTQLDTDLFGYEDGVLILRGNPEFDSEKVVAYELGYRVSLHENLSADLALFQNDYIDLRSLDPDPATFYPVTVGNRLKATSTGAELTVKYKPAAYAALQAGAVFLDIDYTVAPGSLPQAEGNDAEWWYQLRGALDLGENWQLAASLRHVGELPSPNIPSHTDLDIHIAWQASDALELSITGQNLLDPDHPEFGFQRASSTTIPRQFHARATWRF